jgi:hypothetical protein
LQSTPDLSGAPASALVGVSCVSRSLCVAVGSLTPAGGTQVALAERWNGARWSVDRSARPSAPGASALSAVSCTSRRFCIAVGSGPGGAADGAVERIWVVGPASASDCDWWCPDGRVVRVASLVYRGRVWA